MDKARIQEWVGKVKVTKTVRVGEQKPSGGEGVITGVPLSVTMRELVVNLRVCNSAVKDVGRMTRGVEKTETETLVVEFESNEVPKELDFRFVRYNVREFVLKPR